MAEEKKAPDDGALGKIVKDCAETILFPKLKHLGVNLFSDIVYAGAEYVTNVATRKVFKSNDPVNVPRSTYSNGTRYTNYSTRYTQVNGSSSPNSRPSQPQDVSTRSALKLEKIVMPTQDQANAIKAQMIDKIRKSGRASVYDLYSIYNSVKFDDQDRITPSHTDMNFGWSRESDISWTRNIDGWWFNLPSPESFVNFK